MISELQVEKEAIAFGQLIVGFKSGLPSGLIERGRGGRNVSWRGGKRLSVPGKLGLTKQFRVLLGWSGLASRVVSDWTKWRKSLTRSRPVTSTIGELDQR